MDGLALTFLILTCAIAFPFAFASLILNLLPNKRKYIIPTFISLITIGLCIGALVNAILGLTLSGTVTYGYYDSYSHMTRYYSYFYRHPCSWVALGLSCGAMFVGAISLLIILIIRIREALSNKSKVVKPQPQIVKTEPRNSNYIQELKGLKELLDMGAITQEDYDMKKKEILERR